MNNNINEKLKSVLSGQKSSYEPVMRLLSSPEGKELINSLSPQEKKAIMDKFMSLDKKTIGECMKNFNPSSLSGMSAQDILNKLR